MRYEYSITSEVEGRTFECALLFAAYDPESERLVAASFAGRPSPVKALVANVLSGASRSFAVRAGEEEVKVWAGSGGYRSFVERCGEILHALVLFDDSTMIYAPDGDARQALSAWASREYGLPPELDAGRVFCLKEYRVLRDPECPAWPSLRVLKVERMVHSGSLAEEDVLACVASLLRGGAFSIPPSSVKGEFRPEWDLQEYLKANAAVFGRQLDAVRPLHGPGDKLDPALVMDRVPFPAQAHAAQALAKVLERDRLALCSADMGTGKSIIALGVANVIHAGKKGRPTRVLISAPGITIPKWQRQEIGQTLPSARVRVISSSEDAARYLREARESRLPEGLSFVLVGIDRAKLGPDPWCAALWKRVKGEKFCAWHCPDCGRSLPDPDGVTAYTGWDLFAAEPFRPGMFDSNGIARKKVRWAMPPKVRKCPHCGAALWRPALKSRGETPNRPRWYVADILRRLGKHFDLYIADEVHQSKAQDSGRGWAYGQMVLCSKKVLALTGTLINGLSTSVKEILWRSDPASLLKLGFTHKTGMVQWASRYGVIERVERVTETDEGVVTRRKKTERQPKEKPGIAPELVAEHLLHRGVFLELQDIGLPLVELKEIPVFVELDPDHEKAYRRFHQALYDACCRAYAAGSKAAFAPFIPATINAVDRADVDQVVNIGQSAIPFFGFGPDYLNAKERELVRLVKENLEEGRGCIVYAFYTDKYGVHERLKTVLRREGIEAEILGDIPPEARFEWLHRAAERGAKVIITNLRRVEVGLDLLPWPTIIFYQMSYDINTVRQAARRAWRIGQERECRIYYLIADGTQQVSQFEMCMTKRAHALLAEGRLDRSELARYSSGASLAADLAQCLAGEDLAEKWRELAAKDVAVATVSEASFAQSVAEARKRLVEETLRLCGVLKSPAPPAEEETFRPKWKELSALAAAAPRKKRRIARAAEGQVSLFDLLAAGM